LLSFARARAGALDRGEAVSVRYWRARGADLAVDLGTANTVVFRRGVGVVLFEPSVVAMDEQSGRVYAVGNEARRMLGRTPATITASRPLRHGVITDFETTEQMLRQFIRRVSGGRSRSSVMVCVPSGLTQVERNAVVEATLATGARDAHLIEEPLAAAIGAGLPVDEAVGSLVLDVGGGTSELAVTALGGIVVSGSLQVGGYDLDEAIVRVLQQQHKLLVGQEQAEQVKIEIGSALDGANEPGTAEIAGRDLVTGLLRRLTVTASDVHRALERPLNQIVDALKDLLERTPAELSADIAGRGVTLVGGGALLQGFDELLRRETGLPVIRDAEPLTTVARGAGAALEDIHLLRRAPRRLP
jgi:rod shape-determining protein MreB and related proteins